MENFLDRNRLFDGVLEQQHWPAPRETFPDGLRKVGARIVAREGDAEDFGVALPHCLVTELFDVRQYLIATAETEIIGNRWDDDVVNVHQHIAAQVVPTGSGIDDDDTVFDRGQQLAKEGVAVARLAELGGGLHQ